MCPNARKSVASKWSASSAIVHIIRVYYKGGADGLTTRRRGTHNVVVNFTARMASAKLKNSWYYS